MSLLLQVSDPHFGTERPAVVAALEALVRAQPPDLLLLSGDITQRATRAQFAAAQAFVARLGVPQVLAIPGNHDIPLFNLPARLFWPYAGFKQAFGDALEPEFENERLLVLALNTTRRWRHVDGELSEAQIERVAQRVEKSPAAQTRLVVVHQPVAVMRPEDAHDRLHGAERALRRWAEAGVDAVLGGHIHLPFVLQLQTQLPDLPRPIWAVQAGTAISRRVRAEADNSVNLIRVGNARRLQVERWDFQPATQRFGCVAVHELI